MRVNLLLVLGLQHEDDLNRDKVVCVIGLGQHELRRRIDGELSSVLQRVRVSRRIGRERGLPFTSKI